MTVEQHLDTLRDHRPLLLACEAIGWLHMAGKAKADFLRGHGGQKSNYEELKWHELEVPPFPWDDRLQWVKDTFSHGSIKWPDTLTAFLSKHRQQTDGLLALLQAGHAMASGIEKQSYPQASVKYLGQDVTHMWLSSAFGRPARNLLADPPELLTQGGWDKLLRRITKLLQDLEALGNPITPHTAIDLKNLWKWREEAIGMAPVGWLRKALGSTLAETRLPNNDVTLFDQSYVAAALFKSATAGAVLEGKKFPWVNNGLKQKTRWRLLTIGMGADHFQARAVKIGDWTGARQALDRFFRKVRLFVEVDLAIGSLLHADGEVAVFSFPGELSDYGQNGYQGGDLQIEDWKRVLTEQLDDFAEKARFETPPYCSISEPSRSLVGMTVAIRKARQALAVPLHRTWQIPGQNTGDGHVCPVCLVRRSTKENGSRKLPPKDKPCDTCKDRRTGRLATWLEGTDANDTIWISEVADANDRVALVSMSLDLEPWLDGTRLDALRTQAISEWRRFNPVLDGQANPIDPFNCFDSLLQYIEGKLQSFDKADPVLSSLQEGYKHENDWPTFFSKIVEDRAPSNQPVWKAADPGHNANWLAHQLLRKLPSPGRIYRFERQAEEFFTALLAEFRELAAKDRNRWRVRRLLLIPDNTGWWDREPYAGRCNDKPLDLLYLQDQGGFITISNLGRFLEESQGMQQLSGQDIPLNDDNNTPATPLKIKTAGEAPDGLGVYSPVLPLELSPVRFRVLLPLEVASACVDRTLAAWNEQFARVWDRLPLRVGVVAFPRLTPFQAVLEAARNMEDDLIGNDKSETWRVTACETREGVTALSLAPPDGQEMLRTIPVALPDGRVDVFYPYLAVEDSQVRFPLDFRHPEGQVFRHATDLRGGDGIVVHPARIATLFMDSTARRFEKLSCRQLAQWPRMRELWTLLERHAPSQTALRGTWAELVERRETWQGADGTWPQGGKEAWLDLARAIFHERLELRGAGLEALVQGAANGLLDWSLDWHLRVLKKNVSGGDR